MRPRLALAACALASVALAACAAPEPAPAADPSPRGCPAPLDQALARAALDEHMHALADAADAADRTRAAGTPGYASSLDYIAARLTAAGYAVTRQPFDFLDFELLAPPRAEVLAPAPELLDLGLDYQVARFSGSGDITAEAVLIGPSDAGCALADFAALPPGAIALVRRGACPFALKAQNAAAAGAAALILFNQGDTPTRQGLFLARVDPGTPIPVLTVPTQRGLELAGAALRVVVDGRAVTRATENLLAETPKTASGAVIMVGAHLDSVPAGPGVNDNGSGVAAALEIALQLPACDLRHQVRVAFWGAEELGLLGSVHYVDALTDPERAAIALYLNLDMVASPNGGRFLYDGDGSAFGDAGPAGSAAIEAALAAYYAARGLPTGETAFDGRSDYGPFIAAGAEGIKSSDAAALFGGAADLAYDPCYHAPCDGRDNYDPVELLRSAQAAAAVIESFAAADPPLPPDPPAARHAGPRPPIPARACAHDHLGAPE